MTDIPPDRAAELDRLDRLARRMDAAFRIPGTGIRLGADTLLGLIPGVGDVAALAPGAWIVLQGRKMGAPGGVQARMAGNLVVDTLIGSVPLVGDLFDIGWKGNMRNVALLRDHFGAAGHAPRQPWSADGGPPPAGAGPRVG
ncbi:MAG: DUF4112 domain-containing protein [Paracoccaceae bacterium]